MTDLSNKILDILKEEGISSNDVGMELLKVKEEIESSLWEDLPVMTLVFCSLRDCVFFNLEHLPHNDQLTGKTSLKYYSTKYPFLMLTDGIIYPEDVNSLSSEIKDISSKLSKNMHFCKLHSKTEFDWRIGDNASKMLVYNKDFESPAAHGYYNNNERYSGILDSAGQKIKSNDEMVLCAISKIDEYTEYNLFVHLLNGLSSACNSALRNNKGIRLIFENYE